MPRNVLKCSECPTMGFSTSHRGWAKLHFVFSLQLRKRGGSAGRSCCIQLGYRRVIMSHNMTVIMSHSLSHSAQSLVDFGGKLRVLCISFRWKKHGHVMGVDLINETTHKSNPKQSKATKRSCRECLRECPRVSGNVPGSLGMSLGMSGIQWDRSNSLTDWLIDCDPDWLRLTHWSVCFGRLVGWCTNVPKHCCKSFKAASLWSSHRIFWITAS